MSVSRAAIVADRSVSQTGTQVTGQAKKTLGKDDFLKLMITKLRYNDALMGGQDGGDTEFISQMAQFTSLEQMENLNGTMTQVAGLQSLNQGATLLGRQIEAMVSGSDQTIVGTVSAVEYSGNSATLVVGGQRVPASGVIRVS